MTAIDRVGPAKQFIYGLSILLFSPLLLVGFLSHPDLLSLQLTTTAAELAANFHHSAAFHIGHLIVIVAIPLIVAELLCCAEILRGRGAWFGFIGAAVGIVGAIVLAIDKGALCLVLSAFDTLPEDQFAAFVPYLQVIVDRTGLLFIVYLLPLLPFGAIIQAIGLMREGRIASWQGAAIIVGLLLLNNPDIEIFSSIGAALMTAGYAPLGIAILRGGRGWAGMAPVAV